MKRKIVLAMVIGLLLAVVNAVVNPDSAAARRYPNGRRANCSLPCGDGRCCR